MEETILEWEKVTGNTLSDMDRKLLADFVISGCKKLCEVE
jgi:hypothetical protein